MIHRLSSQFIYCYPRCKGAFSWHNQTVASPPILSELHRVFMSRMLRKIPSPIPTAIPYENYALRKISPEITARPIGVNAAPAVVAVFARRSAPRKFPSNDIYSSAGQIFIMTASFPPIDPFILNYAANPFPLQLVSDAVNAKASAPEACPSWIYCAKPSKLWIRSLNEPRYRRLSFSIFW